MLLTCFICSTSAILGTNVLNSADVPLSNKQTNKQTLTISTLPRGSCLVMFILLKQKWLWCMEIVGSLDIHAPMTSVHTRRRQAAPWYNEDCRVTSLMQLHSPVSIQFWVFVVVVGGRLILIHSHSTSATESVCSWSRHHQRMRSMTGLPSTIISCKRYMINMRRWCQITQNVDKLQAAPWYDEDCRVAKVCLRKLEKCHRRLQTADLLIEWHCQSHVVRFLFQLKYSTYWSNVV